VKEAVERYLVAVSPRYAETTLLIHRKQLWKLLAFCETSGLERAADISPHELMAFEAWLRGTSPLSSGSVSLAMASARLFLLWAYEHGETLHDFEAFELPRACSPPTPVPSVTAMRKLLLLPDTGTALGQRDQVVLELLYVLGLRRTECVKLNLDDIDLGQAVLEVRGKGGHERSLPLSSGLLGTLRRYLEHGRPALYAGGSALVVGKNGCSRLCGHGLANVLRGYGRRIGLELHPHQLRFACATHLLEAGMEVRLIAALLGHRDLKSTGRYTRVSRHELQRELRRCHPRALAELP
jgi:site-specific recombinase XerD